MVEKPDIRKGIKIMTDEHDDDDIDDIDSKDPYYRLKLYETEASHYIFLLTQLRDSEPEISDVVTWRLKCLVEWTETMIKAKKNDY